jgi:hypothetical protein
VSKKGEKYRAQVKIDGTLHYIGTFKTKEEAGVAYDRFVVDKSTEEVTYVMNHPNLTEQDDDVEDVEEQDDNDDDCSIEKNVVGGGDV